MRAMIFVFVFVTSLIFDSINCQKPEWQTPADSSQHTLKLTDSKACTGTENVLSENVKAKSTTSETVFYRIVSQSPNDGAFDLGLNFIQDQIVTCVKDKVVSPSYDVVLGTFYKPRDENNEATITVKITVQGLAEPKKPVFVKPNPDENADDHVITLLESHVVSDVILTLQATDEDTDTAGLSFNMDQSAAGTLTVFQIEGNHLKFKAGIKPDRYDADKDNVVRTYPIILQVSDGRNAVSLTTTIELQDVNDETPKFEGAITANLAESAKEGDTVLVLTATDADRSAAFNTVSFEVVGTLPSEFRLDNDKILVASGATFNRQDTPKYTFTIKAKDNGDTPLSVDQEFTVNIKAAPTFVDPDPDNTKDEHIIYMCENLQKDDEIMTLQATDPDSDDGSLIFSLDESNSDKVMDSFEINRNILKVKTTVAQDFFDYEGENAIHSYDIVLKVTDETGVSTTLSTKIQIEDDNDNVPVFTGDSEASIIETSPAGTTVIKLTASDKDVSSQFNQVSFTLSGDDALSFVIGGTNKDEILVKQGASFKFETKSSYKLTVTATDNDQEDPMSNTKEITVTIMTAPSFIDPDPDDTKDEHIIYMCETLQKEDDIMTVKATDRDSDDSSLIYSLDNSNSDKVKDLFEIKENVLKVSSTVAQDYFDYEGENAVHSYDIVLKVTDSFGLSAILSTKIQIEDDNDNAPVFTGDSKASILESSPAGTTVIRLTATDKDVSSQFNQVSFTLSGSDASSFVIGGANKDEILVKEGVTFSALAKSSYKVTVTATDNDQDDPNTTNKEITVAIVTAPTFTKPTKDSTIDVNEDSSDGTIVETLEAKDDDGETPSFKLVFQDPATPVKFVLDGDKLKTKGTFDVDGTDAVMLYTLTLKVSDGNDKTADDTIQVKMSIKDSNTKSPVFKTGVPYEANVKETEKVGFIALSVTATDGDLTDPNNKVTYSLSETPDFNIDASKGLITIAKSLAFKTKSVYDLIVTAKDGGGRTATQNVKLTILAEPTFDNLNSPKTIAINENEPTGTSVFTLTITDLDKTWDEKIEIESSSPENIFKIEEDILKTNTNDLNAEKASKYELTFKVTDGDFTVTSEKLTINILDQNDNKPVITKVAEVNLPEDKQIGDILVASIEAKDNDISQPNNVLSYTITSGNDDNTFKIEATSGKIQLISQLTKATYNLQVTVSDQGDPVQSATTEIKFIVDPSTVDECGGSPCKNGATCTSSVNNYVCECVPGFIGENCETNRDECNPNPCKNGGSCTDGINLFTCDCEKGWGGHACSEACKNNKYGKNCEQECNCDTTRLTENVEAQQCDIKEGACKCNTNYVGPTCEDKDECNDESICGNDSHIVCINTIGSYNCECEQFYRKVSNVCTKFPEDKTVNIDTAREKGIKVERSINAVCVDLHKRPVYEKTKEKIKKAEEAVLKAGKSVNVFNITCGSLRYELIVVTDKENVAQLSNELASTSDTMMFDGNNVTVDTVEVNGQDVKASKSEKEQTCAAYNAIEQCSDDYKCVIENNLPKCRKEDDTDNLKLILGLGLGVCLPLLVLALIAAACLYSQLTKSRNEERRQSKKYLNDSLRREASPWHGKMKQNGFRMDTKNYNGHGYDNDKYLDNFYNKKSVYDMPGLSYTSI